MNILQKLKYRHKRHQGWDVNAYIEYEQKMQNDLTQPGINNDIKKWAHQRGFLANRVSRYGLTDDNWQDYLSEREFAWGFPYNNFKYSRWIDDKLTLYYTLIPFRQYMPDYFFLIDLEGRVFKLFDASEDVSADTEGILATLKAKGHLAVKLYSGTEGAGFYHMVHTQDGTYKLNGKLLSENELISFVDGLKNYLITEYLKPCPELAAIYPYTTNSLRVIAINLPGIEDPIAKGLIRFGCKASKEVDNTSQGSVFCFIDVTNGTYSDPQQDTPDGRRIHPERHPDTGAPLTGEIPRWSEVKQLMLDICNYMPELEYMGFDIAVSETGIKLIEINSMPEMTDYQIAGPLKKDPWYGKLWQRALARKHPHQPPSGVND
ncbi:MAG: sugar-transfer associated ATP-grasp domain-containing protein [Fastidiosipilaceae bacterium]|jgi:hypothetical protein|nr:hypothetical protein [Clostridiaceae bacterium]